MLMRVSQYIKENINVLKTMYQYDVKISDYLRLGIYDDYVKLKEQNFKQMYIFGILSDKYDVGISTIKSLIKKLSKEMDL